MLTAQDLIKFEDDVCELFKQKKIHAPIHLDNNNEKQLINVFQNYINPEDWVMCSWRSHYRALLKGVPINQMFEAILQGKSISLCFPEYKVISSAIVGGILPIALGAAMAIKMKKENHKVACFVGDMTSETGIAHECIKYSTNHKLPILWIIEDNNKSVCTNTRESWGMHKLTYEPENYQEGSVVKVAENILYYKYDSIFPHAGPGGARINF